MSPISKQREPAHRPLVTRCFMLVTSFLAAGAYTPPPGRVPRHRPRSFPKFAPDDGVAAAGRRRPSAVALSGSSRKLPSSFGRRPAPRRFADGYELATFEELAGTIRDEMYSKSGSHFHSLDNCPALVLNADYQPLSYLPLSLWPWQDAVKAVFMDRVVVLDTYRDRVVRSAHLEIQLPSVIALKDYVQQHTVAPTFTRRNLYLRDGYKCQYCARFFHSQHLSYDHVLPRRLGGRTQWENVVTCCQRCNNKKSDCHPSNLANIGMRLLAKPHVPSFYELQVRARRYPPRLIHETWESYLFFDKGKSMDSDTA